MITKFSNIEIGEYFKYNNIVWKHIPLIKTGHCGCIPQWNAQDIDDENNKYFFHGGFEVKKLDVYRINPKHNNIIAFILPNNDDTLIIYDNIQEYSEIKYVDIKELNKNFYFIQFEETDSWLYFFNLAPLKIKPYYECFINRKWQRQA